MKKISSILVNVCRIILAVTLILSGFVKAIDPLGTQYKIQDYLSALSLPGLLPEWAALTLSILLSALEFCLGVFLLMAIHRRTVSRLTLLLMAFMTVVSVWLWIANPVSDCGCFGDAIHLTNGQTLLKNVVLLLAAIVVCRYPLRMVRFISKTNQNIVINYTAIFIVAVSLYCLYALPLFDFRPYHVGADIRKGMEIPDTEEQPQFETTFILEKDGVRKEFTLADYPDSTWTFIDSKTVMTMEGYVPPIHDFSIERIDTGDDITEEVLADTSYTFLLISPMLEKASDSDFGDIDQVYEYCQDNGYAFYCLTSSDDSGIERWRDLTGAEYPFCTCDATTLKTIIRSNPGLLLLRDGQVVRKWSHHFLPNAEELNAPLPQLAIGHLPKGSPLKKIAKILLWFAIPLLALTIADRLWAWTHWLRRKRKKEESPQSPENP
ncbi:MAG: DoxX family protein [Prevotella sp.]|nr:DoxX family protein [Prevotella sp.]